MPAEIIFRTDTGTESGAFVQAVRAAETEQADSGFHIPWKTFLYGLELNIDVGSYGYLFAFHAYVIDDKLLCWSRCFCYYKLAIHVGYGTNIGAFDNNGGTDGGLAVTNYNSTRYPLSLCKDHYATGGK